MDWFRKVILFIFVFSLFGWLGVSPKPAQAVFVCDYITVTVPNGGETWTAGTTNNITWTTDNNGMPWDDMDIYYSTDGGSSFPNLIVAGTTDDGQYEWPVPQGLDSATVQVRVVGNLAASICDGQYDDSDGDFTVSAPYSSAKDTMTDASIGDTSEHTIEFGVTSSTVITDGSIKVDFPDDFNLTGVTAADVVVTGGDVVWGAETITVGVDTIVTPFTGNLNSSDGKITMTVGGANDPANPGTTGEYRFAYSTHTTGDGTGNPVESGSFSVYITEEITVSATIPSSLTFIVSGVAASQSVNGETTTIDTTATGIDFGSFAGAGSAVGAQDLAVETNATDGFTVTLQRTSTFQNAASDVIFDFSGTNAVPTAWSTPPGGGTEGYFGYTTDDNDLGTGTPARFISDKWAGPSTSPEEVMYHTDPTDGTGEGAARVGYQLEVTDDQESGVYTTTLMYIITAIY